MSKNFDIKKLTVIQICNYIAVVNKLVDEKLIKFNPNKAAVMFNYDKASRFLEEQNIELKERINKAVEYINDNRRADLVFKLHLNEDEVDKLLEILKGKE